MAPFGGGWGGGGGWGTIPETGGEKNLITLSAHIFFFNCSVKIVLSSNCS